MIVMTTKEIDTLVHEEVLGFCVHEWETMESVGPDVSFGEWLHTCEKCEAARTSTGHDLSPISGLVPAYSRDIAVAWSVLLHFVEIGFGVRVDQPFDNGRWRAEVYSKCRQPFSSPLFGEGDTAPQAICKVALLRAGVPV